MHSVLTTDYHMHSTFSPDGHHTPAEICQAALAMGLAEIAITDHVEWEPGGRHLRPDYDRYFDEIAACRATFGPQGLSVLSGVELGNPHEHRAEVEDLLAARQFDVVISSLHWLDGQNVHDTRCFNGQGPYPVYSRYFEKLGEIAASVPCHLIAHFDRIFWPGSTLYGPPDVHQVEEPVRRALAAMATHGRVLEINTRFLTYEPGWNDSIVTILRWFREAGGTQVAVNSDAHRATEIGRSREVGQALLEAAGFEAPWQCPAVQAAGS